MQDESMTGIEFQKRFGTEEQCKEALAKLRWPNGFVCPNCGHDDGYQLRERPLIQCLVCRHQTSVTAGTIFHRTHVPLTCWFWMIYHVACDKGGASSSRIASQLGMWQKTVWHMLQKIRHAMDRRDSGISLAGLIELDEAVLGPEARRGRKGKKSEAERKEGKPRGKRLGRKGKDGRKRKTQIEVLVMVEAERFHAGNLVLKKLEATNYDTIKEVVEQRVDPAQIFKTDMKQSHAVLLGMGHRLFAKKSGGADSLNHLPIVHKVIGRLKQFLLSTHHGVSRKYLAGYLQEFVFRFIRRDKEPAMPLSLLRACIFTLPMTYAELTT